MFLLPALLAVPALAQTPASIDPASASCQNFDACPDSWTCIGVNCCPPWMSLEDCSKFNGIGPHRGDDWDDDDDWEDKNGDDHDDDDLSPGMPTATNVTAVPSATHRAGDDDGHDSDDDDDNVDDDNDDDDDDDDRTSTVSASATASVSAKETPAIALSPSPSAPARSSASIAAPGASGAPANSAATAQYGVSLLLAAVVLGVAGLNW